MKHETHKNKTDKWKHHTKYDDYELKWLAMAIFHDIRDTNIIYINATEQHFEDHTFLPGFSINGTFNNKRKFVYILATAICMNCIFSLSWSFLGMGLGGRVTKEENKFLIYIHMVLGTGSVLPVGHSAQG